MAQAIRRNNIAATKARRQFRAELAKTVWNIVVGAVVLVATISLFFILPAFDPSDMDVASQTQAMK